MNEYQGVNKNSILFFLPASQFNNVEFFTVKNFLEKNKIRIFITSDSNSICKSTTGQIVRADINLYNIHESNFCGIVLIGGAGARQYWHNSLLQKVVVKFNQAGKIVAAICSSSIIIANAGVLQNMPATCCDENKIELIKAGVEYKDVPIVAKNNIITAKCSTASLEFADTILQLIKKSN